MAQALQLAERARDMDEVPVGAVITLDGELIARGFNQPIKLLDCTAHAEIIALRQASLQIHNYRLLNTTVYTTLEPCPMCAGALVHARVSRLVIATADKRSGACGSVFNLIDGTKLNHGIEVEFGLYQDEASLMLKDFFKHKR